MTGLDTNILARYYVDDQADAVARRQRLTAKRLLESGQPLMVCKTVVLELEWLLRGYYGFTPAEVSSVIAHLMALPHLTVEDRNTVEQALRLSRPPGVKRGVFGPPSRARAICA